MLAANRGYPEIFFKEVDDFNIRICINHFHLSVIVIDENGKYRLKTGAASTIYLNTFSMKIENYKEE